MARTAHAPVVLHGRTEAEAHVGMTCFKLGPPSLLGAELEFLVSHRDDPMLRPALAELVEALGEHSPHSISPLSPALPLPGGSAVTVEPGGQVELSSSPYPDAASLCSALAADAEVLGDRLAGCNLRPVTAAADPLRPPVRLLDLPRYRAMETALDRVGPFGRLMMTNTAATQVAVDAGRAGGEVHARWALLHEAGPALVAAFACSPALRGAPPGRGPRSGCGRGSSWTPVAPLAPCTPAATRGRSTRAGRWTSRCCACVRTGRA